MQKHLPVQVFLMPLYVEKPTSTADSSKVGTLQLCAYSINCLRYLFSIVLVDQRKGVFELIRFENVTKRFGNKTVLDDISLDIRDNELTVLIGPSGCGKTTTLKMMNRLISPTQGKITIDDLDIEAIDKIELRRKMGYVIQQGGLFPHMTIRENIEIIEKLEKKDAQHIIDNTQRLMEMVDLDPDEYLESYPTELSGGQRQRIGVIRALANDPKIILMDEPFSALDPITRNNLQEEFIKLQKKVEKTIVFVTHDMDEAIRVADRICIMKDGHIVQFDTPETLLRHPADEFVESFVGANRIWDSPEYIKVEDFMIRDPITCPPDMSKAKCLNLMASKHVDTLMVTDGDGKLMGVIGRKQLYWTADPMAKAEDMAYSVRYVAKPDDNIVDILKVVDEQDINSIPVVDCERHLLGLLTNSNLVSTLSRQFLSEEEEAAQEAEAAAEAAAAEQYEEEVASE